jgi:rubrerythrin
MINPKSIQTEVDASYLYGILADNEENADVANIFRQMSDIENKHAIAFIKKTD